MALLQNILFLDIETVPLCASFDELTEEQQHFWNKKVEKIGVDDQQGAEIYQQAGIYAEFGKIVCISVGYLTTPDITKIRLKSFYGDDEKQLLTDFAAILEQYYATPQHALCGHNGKEFDFPFIARRMLINGVSLPSALQMQGKKPWEINHLDTLELWKFGDYKHYTSLDLLCHVFDIPSPKDGISGADIYRVYYEEQGLELIKEYCEKDVQALAHLYLKMTQLN